MFSLERSRISFFFFFRSFKLWLSGFHFFFPYSLNLKEVNFLFFFFSFICARMNRPFTSACTTHGSCRLPSVSSGYAKNEGKLLPVHDLNVARPSSQCALKCIRSKTHVRTSTIILLYYRYCTSLFCAGKDETNLSGRVRGDGREGVVHRCEHLCTGLQNGRDERQV